MASFRKAKRLAEQFTGCYPNPKRRKRRKRPSRKNIIMTEVVCNKFPCRQAKHSLLFLKNYLKFLKDCLSWPQNSRCMKSNLHLRHEGGERWAHLPPCPHPFKGGKLLEKEGRNPRKSTYRNPAHHNNLENRCFPVQAWCITEHTINIQLQKQFGQKIITATS